MVASENVSELIVEAHTISPEMISDGQSHLGNPLAATRTYNLYAISLTNNEISKTTNMYNSS